MKIITPAPKPILHPLLIALTVWSGVGILYSLRFSRLLIYNNETLLGTLSLILSPYLLISLLFFGSNILSSSNKNKQDGDSPASLAQFEKKLTIAFKAWIALATIETIVTGGLPILWIFLAPNKSYADYGIPSVHGFVNSLIFSISTARFGLFLYTSERRHLKYPLFGLIWSILVISRSMTLILLLQYSVLFLRLRRVHVTLMLKLCAGLVSFLLLFGVAGEFRQSNTGEVFRDLALPSANYPDWMPNTVLWSYIYISTPINNLMYNMDVVKPTYNFLFPNTASELFPTVLRNIIYGENAAEAYQGQLVVQTFNASTAFVGPWQDFGSLGILLFSTISALLGTYFWGKRNLRDVLIFAVTTQCLILTLFFNNYFNLPVLCQLFWFTLLLSPRSIRTANISKHRRHS